MGAWHELPLWDDDTWDEPAPVEVAASIAEPAAVETSHRMLEAGMTAEGQRREARSKPSEGGSDAD